MGVVRQEEAKPIQVDRLVRHRLSNKTLRTLEPRQGIPPRRIGQVGRLLEVSPVQLLCRRLLPARPPYGDFSPKADVVEDLPDRVPRRGRLPRGLLGREVLKDNVERRPPPGLVPRFVPRLQQELAGAE